MSNPVNPMRGLAPHPDPVRHDDFEGTDDERLRGALHVAQHGCYDRGDTPGSRRARSGDRYIGGRHSNPAHGIPPHLMTACRPAASVPSPVQFREGITTLSTRRRSLLGTFRDWFGQ